MNKRTRIPTKYLPEGICGASHRIDEIIEAAAHNMTLEGRVILCDGDCNLTVDLGCCHAVIPRAEAQLSFGGEPKEIAYISRVGKNVCFKVARLGEEIILSRREAQLEAMENFISRLTPGDIIPARVTHLEYFGAFVDIGCGIVSMLPIDCISVSRIPHPSDFFSVGELIRVVVKGVDREYGRVCLTHKELLGSWAENASRFNIGQTVTGIARSIEEYGIFVELAPNLAGLAETRSGITAGSSVAVYIKNILPQRMKIKLVIVDGGTVAAKRVKPGYFIPDTVTHIDSFRYSPPESEKLVESVFGSV